MTRLSLVVTTFNNASTLDACLKSAAPIVDEILVADSFSQDQTLSIAKAYQARIVQQAFAGYGPQKQWACDQASCEWILLLDADESLSYDLQDELLGLKQAGLTGPGYRIARREWMAWQEPIEQHGRWQRAGVKLTDHLRLFDRRLIALSTHPVHAAPYSEQPLPRLQSELLHTGDAPFAQRLKKARHYAQLNAQHQTAGPRWVLYAKRWLSPLWAFIQDYGLRRYFLDGRLGLAAAWCSARASVYKYQALLHQSKN